ncbi:non-hydrolyzing UDP-N-acetylglucosamine 2-epimerase [Shouchella patagoniensis]|uniref:non-hydrolyzing UDP-N-acetylglucosamine 2-epimerase n=1 Tax=Shouchella patagoniensis TaxID=228576 RepID=UPI0009954B17|nr:UDP-N-acetylglucosamine 2-epimerase (non-hydrolyzing) [Shouchella patagoniensis]
MKIVTVIGARPQFIKACMVSKRLRQDPSIQEVLVHTGQHYNANMSDVFFTQLNIPKPDYHLGIGSGSHGEQTGKMLIELEQVFIKEKPDAVLVYGDTNSTIAGSLASSKLHIPIIHVESGLRSFNRYMPEEINRIVTDHLSSLLFCPSQAAANQLKNEGITKGVYATGDIMYDAVLHYKAKAEKQSAILSQLNLTLKEYYVATIHRAENTDDLTRLSAIMEGLSKLGKKVILPLHPRTKKQLQQLNAPIFTDKSSLLFIDPLDYFDMLALMSQAKAIVTDSGGVQKEAYMLRIPCVTLRDETEWIETVEAKWNRLADARNPTAILKAVQLAKEQSTYPALFGDGHSADQIYTIIKKNFPS